MIKVAVRYRLGAMSRADRFTKRDNRETRSAVISVERRDQVEKAAIEYCRGIANLERTYNKFDVQSTRIIEE